MSGRATLTIRGSAFPVSAGDVNGDGHADFMFGKCNYDKGPGRVRVVFGDPSMQGKLNLATTDPPGFVITGDSKGDCASIAAPAGDVNGDERSDLLIGAPGSDNNERNASGTAYVVFGKSDQEPVTLSDLDATPPSDAGFRIDGAASRDRAGDDVAGIGDINLDGLDDVVVGTPFGGGSYVVYGKADSLPVDLLTFDLSVQRDSGWRIDTPNVDSNDGYSVAAAGDVNGDDVPDVLIGLVPRPMARGSVYVVFGEPDSASVDVRDLGDRGFRIAGAWAGSYSGYETAPAGDVNLDGYDDVAVGAPALSFVGAGDVYVVFGKTSTEGIRLDRVGKCPSSDCPPRYDPLRGYRIRGVIRQRDKTGQGLGVEIARLSDLNGDERPELALGAPLSAFRRKYASGSAYVVFGQAERGTIRLEDLGRLGCRLDGSRSYHGLGDGLASFGDLDADGLDELLIGASGVGGHPQFGLDDPGATYLVPGNSLCAR